MTIKAYMLAIRSPPSVRLWSVRRAGPSLCLRCPVLPCSQAAVPMAATDARYRKDTPRYWDYSADWDYPTYGQRYDAGSERYC